MMGIDDNQDKPFDSRFFSIGIFKRKIQYIFIFVSLSQLQKFWIVLDLWASSFHMFPLDLRDASGLSHDQVEILLNWTTLSKAPTNSRFAIWNVQAVQLNFSSNITLKSIIILLLDKVLKF